MTSNSLQIGGEHYKGSSYQPWDFALDAFDGCFFLGNANKYITRHRKKNGKEDLEKALHYLAKFLELLDTRRIEPPLSHHSHEGREKLLAHYCEANDIGLAERDILSLMMRGNIPMAWANLHSLVKELYPS